MKKAVYELKPGDIINTDVFRRLVVDARPVAGGVALTLASIGPGCILSPPDAYDPDHEFEVERAELTQAQQHAEELLVAARAYLPMLEERCAMYQGPASVDDDLKVIALRTLLKRIEPPKPPTAQELATSLAKLAADGAVGPQLNDAMALLARARQAGML